MLLHVYTTQTAQIYKAKLAATIGCLQDVQISLRIITNEGLIAHAVQKVETV